METRASFTDAETERERAHRALALEAAVEGIVLLENDGVLPLEPGRLALFGAGAERTVAGGTGSGEVNVRHEVSVAEGLEAAGFEVATWDWIERYERLWRKGREAFIRERRESLFPPSPKAIANLMACEYRYPVGDPIDEGDVRESGTDTCVYVLSRQSGEGHDRTDEPGDFRLGDAELASIARCAEGYERFVLVLNAGGPLDLTPLDEIAGIDAIVFMGQLGMEGGTALAAVLSGETSPSGRLALTWAKRYADYPSSEDFGPYAKDPGHARYREGIYVGYRYFDSFGAEPRYPFGYGRGYTAFSLEATEVAVQGAALRLEAEVANVGERSGKEVAQVYVSCPRGEEPKEFQRLAAFAKTRALDPGESERLDLSFELSTLASYDEASAETYLEAGDYVVRLGTSSRETAPVAVLRLGERAVLARHRNLCRAEGSVQRLQAPERVSETLPADLPILGVDSTALPTVTFDYELPEERFPPVVERHLEGFSARDMARFCAGSGLFGEGKGLCAPGAVGHTTAAYLEQGIPNRELSDGPAGLRLQRRSVLERNGKIKAVDLPLSIYEYLPRALTRPMLGDPAKGRMLYQEVTGFPVAAAIAQSWNTELAERIGHAVGKEMEAYGITWWLAPALNIVRDPLCGRAFEYFSEDPLVSGRFAAALTRGVQAVPRRFATIKHFAANSQEDHRHHVSSDVDERVLREIYLRGFEIAVREGRPGAVMSAYNRLNGVYCANDGELCNAILRCEWGFDGIVMTDWLSTGRNLAKDGDCPGAGVDLIMPGGKGTVRALLKAHREGRLPADVLRRSCGRVLREILA